MSVEGYPIDLCKPVNLRKNVGSGSGIIVVTTGAAVVISGVWIGIFCCSTDEILVIAGACETAVETGEMETESEVQMDDLNITMERYIRLEEEKARRRAIVFNETLTSEIALSCEPMLNEADLVIDAENLLIEIEIQDVDDHNVDTDAEENLIATLAPQNTPRPSLYLHSETPRRSVYWEPNVEGIYLPLEGKVFNTIEKTRDVIEDIYVVEKPKQNHVNNPQGAINKGGQREERRKSGREIALKVKTKQSQKWLYFAEKTNKHTKTTCPLNPKYVAKLTRLAAAEQEAIPAAATEQAARAAATEQATNAF
nr:hypothetical protein [Tanacetum cinerariifolium]